MRKMLAAILGLQLFLAYLCVQGEPTLMAVPDEIGQTIIGGQEMACGFPIGNGYQACGTGCPDPDYDDLSPANCPDFPSYFANGEVGEASTIVLNNTGLQCDVCDQICSKNQTVPNTTADCRKVKKKKTKHHIEG
jgi:hypothetical protein